MKNHWILVANGSVVRIFSRAKAGDSLVAVGCLNFPEGHFKDSEFECERHDHRDNGSAAVQFEPHSSTRKKVPQQIARQLGMRLEEGAVDGEFDVFWLIAPGPLMSEIKAHLKRGVDYRLQWTYDADLTGLSMGALESRLREIQQPAC